jgi:SulP family sulfate permease
LVQWLQLPVTTIETTFGEIPNSLSLPSVPHIDLATVKALIQPALAIAFLGGIESLLSAVVSDGMIGGRHRSNAELVAQGVANCASAMFGGIPATGALARTATNVKNGGRTPIAGITHALVLLLIMLLLAPYAKLIPMAALAGILVVVAYHMSEWRQFKSLLRGNASDVLILLTTFFLTVIFDLVIAIEVGIVLSSFVVMKRMSDSMSIENAVDASADDNENGEKLFEEELPVLPKGVAIYEIHGALFFGVAQLFQDTINNLQNKPKVLILRMRHVPFIDATGIYRLKEVIKQFNSKKVNIILSGVNAKVLEDLEKADIYSVLEKKNLLRHISGSITRANAILTEE